VTSDLVPCLSLPDDFSETSETGWRNRRAGSPRGATSSEASLSAIDRPFGETPSGKSFRLKGKLSRGQRLLDGLAGTRVRGRTLSTSKASNAVAFEKGVRSNIAMMLYSMKPPPLAVNNRQVVIPGVIQFSRHFRTQQPFSCYAAGLSRSFYLPLTSPSTFFGRSYLSCSKPTRRECPALRNFDTEPQSSYRYEVRSDNRLESVANAHTAADLHVRPASQTALVSRTVGAAND
jgi:hypothetical protein